MCVFHSLFTVPQISYYFMLMCVSVCVCVCMCICVSVCVWSDGGVSVKDGLYPGGDKDQHVKSELLLLLIAFI